VTRREKEGGRGLRPCEETRAPVGGRTSCFVAEVSRRRLASNKLGTALQKEWPGSSERGPSSERRLAGQTVGFRVARNGSSRVGLTALSGEDRRKAQGGVRAPPAAETSPKAVQPSRDRGCKGHRILRRVPADRRHPGSSRGVAFTRGAHGWSWRSSASSDPCLLAKSWRSRSSCSSREGERGARVNG